MNPAERITTAENDSPLVSVIEIIAQDSTLPPNLIMVAKKLLEKKELLKAIPMSLDGHLGGYGVNLQRIRGDSHIDIKGVTFNPRHISPELVLHEIVHTFTMPVMASMQRIDNTPEYKNISDVDPRKIFWRGIKALWSFVQSKGYSPTNSHSVHNTIEEFVVNITNESSLLRLQEVPMQDCNYTNMQGMKTWNAGQVLFKLVFDYVDSIKIKNT
jgi:hypothetical protein